MQVDIKGTQPCIYVYPFSPKLPSHLGCYITLFEFPVLYNRSLLVILYLNLKKKTTFYFLLGYSRLAKNVVIVSDEQRRDSAMSYIYMCPFYPHKLSSQPYCHITLSSFMYYTAGSCWLSILNIAACTYKSQTMLILSWAE